jgi:hypothetical protein
MLCLACGHHQQTTHPHCARCSEFLGYPAEGSGYLTQLQRLQQAVHDRRVSEDQAEDRLLRLDEALSDMVTEVDALGAALLGAGLEEVHNSTLAGFLMPVREALTRLRAAASELRLDGEWSKAEWGALKEAQRQLLQANQGIAYVHQALTRRGAGN